MRRLILFLTLLLPVAAAPGLAGPLPLVPPPEVQLPPVIEDSTAPHPCTIAYLVADVRMNDVYAARMRITPAANARAVDGRMSCPSAVPPRLAAQAMVNCKARVADANQCVFADMARGFESEPEERNTAENTSRCASDRFTHIGIACWKAEGMDVCNVGCGQSGDDARSEARQRCEDKHQRSCAITGAMTILLP